MAAPSSSGGGDDEAVTPNGRGAETLEVSNAMVRIYKNQFGRGPTSTRTDYAGSNTLICTLYGSMTPAEKTLTNMGESEKTRDLRLLLQYAAETQLRDEVTRITRRTVVAFVSGVDVQQDVAAEIFYLEPAA